MKPSTSPIIDFHVHAAPDLWRRYLPSEMGERLQQLRGKLRNLTHPYSASVHQLQTSMRILPAPLRNSLDHLAPMAPIPMFFFESTPDDLREAMAESSVDRAVVIAHPPALTNDFILELVQARPELIAAVNIPSRTADPAAQLREFVGKGAQILKIHPAADGEGSDSPRYHALLAVAAELGLPVIIHTGCMHSRALYRAPELGHVELFAPWFKQYPSLRFMLAHMNFHDPGIALDLGERFENVLVDTSWQPAEAISEAVRRLGAERVFFGSDWPIAGHNIAIGVGRIRDCVESGFFGEAEAALILGGNAQKLLSKT